MPVSRSLRRLLHIRTLQEQQSRMELESALGELRQLEHALASAASRATRGRALIGSSANTGELADRLAGLEEARAASRHTASLQPRIEDAREDASELRRHFLDRRVERRQAETLVSEAEARDAIDVDRRTQQALDDAFGSRRMRAQRNAAASERIDSRDSPAPAKG